MKLFSIFFIFFNTALIAQNFTLCPIDMEKLQHKFTNEPFARWKQEQIERDLAPFADQGISQENINATINKIISCGPRVKQNFFRYRIVDNALYCQTSHNKHNKSACGYITTVIMLKKLVNLFEMPDVDFILYTYDGIPMNGIGLKSYSTKDPQMQAPILARAKRKGTPHIILTPDEHSFLYFSTLRNNIIESAEKNPWGEKIEKAFWRGSVNSVKMGHAPKDQTGIFLEGRCQLCKHSNSNPEHIDAKLVHSNKNQSKKNIERKTSPSFFGPRTSTADHLKYKYLPVLDGQMCTYPGYQWRLLSNSLAFKQESDEVQWFYQELKPYVHYIPIKNLMEDLNEKIIWAKNNDAECKKISENATKFIENDLTLEDLYIYYYHILKEYAKLQKFNKEDLKLNNENSNWRLLCKKQENIITAKKQ